MKKKDMHDPGVSGTDVGAMFDAIAPRYDFLNHLLSLGIDRQWRRKAVKRLGVATGACILDMACGTGDMAMEIIRQYPHTRKVAGMDISGEMLSLARRKAARAGYGEKVQWSRAGCEMIPAADHTFDGAVMAFGIRNVADRCQSLRELRRVLKPGARLLILEFSHPSSRFFRVLFNAYFHGILPWIGGLFSRRSAYRYLPRSVAAFPANDEFARLIARAGFSHVRYQPLTCGVVTLFESLA